MELIVDANILFAALIKKNVTSDLIVKEALNLHSVEYLFTEFKKFEELIKNKTERTDEEFDIFLEIIQRRIDLIPLEEIDEFIAKAEDISPDENDVPYFALALKLKCPIWSNDKKLKNQDEIRIYSTEEVLNILKR